jgi:hypothetical protein
MTRDAIVDEVRAIRDEIANAYGYDINAIFCGAAADGRHRPRAPRVACATENLGSKRGEHLWRWGPTTRRRGRRFTPPLNFSRFDGCFFCDSTFLNG